MGLQLNLPQKLQQQGPIVWHRVHTPQTAADRLIVDVGLVKALSATAQQLHAARRARSRPRYQFWTQVRETLAQSLMRPN